MAAAITARTKVVLLCTPNNPTGPALTDAEVRAFVDRVPGDVLVVVDEAYREFVRLDDPLDALALVRQRSNVVVMRTFAKAYGLAGLRVGYLVGPEEVATAVRACALPFGVSSVAQAAAVASLAAEADLLERVDAIVGERTRVAEALAAQGWELPEAQGNFVWFPVGDRALELAAAAEEAGVMVRPFAGDGVRVSIGEAEANDRLVEVARRFRAGSHAT
jgi:histidinol-phosphate aminotransferase